MLATHTQSTEMGRLNDLIVYSKDNAPVLAVEIKSANARSTEDAIRLRQARAEPTSPIKPQFFLLVAQATLYLWSQDDPANAPPQVASAQDVFLTYAGSIAKRGQELSHSAIESVAQAWLDDLAGEIRLPKDTSPADQLLVKAGIYDKIRHGTVRLRADS